MGWPPKDWLALIALLGSIAGAAVLTLFVWWGCWMLLPAGHGWTAATEDHRAYTIRWVLWISAGTISLVIIGLGFAISQRKFKGQLGKDGATFDFEGGERPEIPDVAFGKDN